MILSLTLASSFFVSPARAEGTELPLPFVGAYEVGDEDGCTMNVVAAPWNSDRAGNLMIDRAEAGRICSAAKGNLMIAEAKAKAIVARADAEAALIAAAAIPVMTGGSVDYESTPGGKVRLVTGPAADWHAYGTAITTGNGMIGGMPMGYVDPSMAMLYRLGAGQAAFGAHPAIPGVVFPMQSASSDTALGECHVNLAGKTALLKECQGS